MLNQSAMNKQLLKIQRKYRRKLRRKYKRQQSERDNVEKSMSQTAEFTQNDKEDTQTNTNSMRLEVTPTFYGQKNNENTFTFSPSARKKFAFNHRRWRSQSDPSSKNYKWSPSNHPAPHTELLYFQLSAADTSNKPPSKTTMSTTEHPEEASKQKEPRLNRAKTMQPKKQSLRNKKKRDRDKSVLLNLRRTLDR